MTQLTLISSNFYWNIYVKICILDQIIATIMFIWIFCYEEQNIDAQISINNGHTNRGWSPCAYIVTSWPQHAGFSLFALFSC